MESEAPVPVAPVILELGVEEEKNEVPTPKLTVEEDKIEASEPVLPEPEGDEQGEADHVPPPILVIDLVTDSKKEGDVGEFDNGNEGDIDERNGGGEGELSSGDGENDDGMDMTSDEDGDDMDTSEEEEEKEDEVVTPATHSIERPDTPLLLSDPFESDAGGPLPKTKVILALERRRSLADNIRL